MSQINFQDLRNIALVGNGNAGKTVLADKILTSTGTIKRPASVDAWNAQNSSGAMAPAA